jgi:uncharacterized membrane protein
LAWTLAGAVAGFVGSLFLLSPKRFFGSILILLGIVLAMIPMNYADGSTVPVKAYCIKIGIGLALLLLGVVLIARAWKRMR